MNSQGNLPSGAAPASGIDFEPPAPGENVAPATENDYEDLLDGVYHELTFLEEVKDEAKPKKVVERLLIRKISIQKMDVLAKSWGKLQLEAAAYIDRPIQRVAQLTDKSFETVISEGRRLNFLSFKKWFGWQAQTLEAVGQGEKMGALVKEVMATLKKPDSAS